MRKHVHPYDVTPNFLPRKFNEITKLDGPLDRHIEQLWDEIKKLKERIEKLESK